MEYFICNKTVLSQINLAIYYAKLENLSTSEYTITTTNSHMHTCTCSLSACVCLSVSVCLVHSYFHVYSFGSNFLSNDFVLHVVLESSFCQFHKMYIVHYICITKHKHWICKQKWHAFDAHLEFRLLAKREFSTAFFWTCLYSYFHIASVYHFGLDFPFLISHFTFYIRNHLKSFHNKLETELQPSYIYYNQMTTAIQGITTHTHPNSNSHTSTEKMKKKNIWEQKSAPFLFCLLKW